MKMHQIVTTSLNGDANDVDPAVRRTMYAMSDELDDWRADMLDEVRGVKRLLMGLTGTVVTGLLLGVAQVLLSL